jgi:GT2 family glycosyltransferase
MSVVMPSYNHGRLIPEALVAIARQTPAPFEVVVVDGRGLRRRLRAIRTQSRRRHWHVR